MIVDKLIDMVIPFKLNGDGSQIEIDAIYKDQIRDLANILVITAINAKLAPWHNNCIKEIKLQTKTESWLMFKECISIYEDRVELICKQHYNSLAAMGINIVFVNQ